MYFAFFKKHEGIFYFLFRITVGFLFFSHGYDKFGGFGGTTFPAFSLMWLAGIIEIAVGLGIFFGVFTRLAALGGAVQMAVAYFKVHAAGGLHPLINKGELALLYFVIFLIILIYGAGKWSLGTALFKKEVL
ncbi:MAG: DoxX family protein [Nanoarchaeota archaeon]